MIRIPAALCTAYNIAYIVHCLKFKRFRASVGMTLLAAAVAAAAVTAATAAAAARRAARGGGAHAGHGGRGGRGIAAARTAAGVAARLADEIRENDPAVNAAGITHSG